MRLMPCLVRLFPKPPCPVFSTKPSIQWHVHTSYGPRGRGNTVVQQLTRGLLTLNKADAISLVSFVRPASSSTDLSITSDSADSAAILISQLDIKLPNVCTGCGVRLQRTDPDAPGYFVVPKRLIEAAMERQREADEKLQEVGEKMQAADIDTASPVLPPSEFDDKAEDMVAAARGGDLEEAEEEVEEEEGAPEVICARCFSLKHSGKVKSGAAESALPEFDLGRKVGRKIQLQRDRRAVVLCVVDITDFDGSLPRMALQSLIPPGVAEGGSDQQLKFKLMVAVNKFDLMPEKATALRVEQWVRMRLKQSGLPPPEKVFMVSAVNGFGVKAMMEDVRSALGLRADLWVVGAQNAGKSSLISAMKRQAGTGGQREPTIAPLPGTTLGLLWVEGIPLGPKNRAYDTPGVPHPYQLTSLLVADELRMVLPRRRLKPRTYRIGAGYSLLIGGLARVDVVDSPSATLYLTVFASSDITLHCGKTEGAEERRERHGGTMLLPPADVARLEELGPLFPRDVTVGGESWQRSGMDVVIAGLGWVGVGLEGEVKLRVWTYKPVAITTRQALVPDYAKEFERPGFSTLLPKAPAATAGGSKGGANKQKKQKASAKRAGRFQ